MGCLDSGVRSMLVLTDALKKKASLLFREEGIFYMERDERLLLVYGMLFNSFLSGESPLNEEIYETLKLLDEAARAEGPVVLRQQPFVVVEEESDKGWSDEEIRSLFRDPTISKLVGYEVTLGAVYARVYPGKPVSTDKWCHLAIQYGMVLTEVRPPAAVPPEESLVSWKNVAIATAVVAAAGGIGWLIYREVK